MPERYTRDQLRRATQAVHGVTGGGIPFGRPRKQNGVTVSAELVARAALDAATRLEVAEPLHESILDSTGTEGEGRC